MPRKPDQPRFEVHAHRQRTGVLLSFSVGVPEADRVSVLDLHHLLLNDDGGIGMVGYLSTQHSGLYHWPRRDRGSASLIEFIAKCGPHYFATKMRLDDDFDPQATEDAVRVEVKAKNPDDAEEIMEGYYGSDLQSFNEWLAGSAPKAPGSPWERFRAQTRVEPFFESFVRYVQPWLKEHRAEVEALLYPNGVPA